MANILDLITVGNLDIVIVDGAPNTGLGVDAPTGSLILVNDGSGIWIKNSATATDWIQGVTTATLGSYGVSSITGTSGRITASASVGAVTLDISASYAGQSSITTLGTITTGTWNGNPIANAYLANSSFTINGTLISLGGTATVTAAAGTLTGSSLNPSITGSSLTSVGTITTGVWNGTAISDTYISSSANWNVAYSNRITSLTTTGNSGSATLSSNTLNIPTYTISGLGGVNKAGDTMTGLLILSGDPAAALGAATKQYVDNIASGITYLTQIIDPNLKDDSLNTPPPAPTSDSVYIVGASPTGAWAGKAGRALYYDTVGGTWVDLLGRAVAIGDRFGVLLENNTETTAGGLTGKANNIAQITNATPGSITYIFTAPAKGNSVYANGTNHGGDGYYYNGTSWVEFINAILYSAGAGLALNGSQFSIATGGVTNAMLVNSSVTINGTSVSLGNSATVTAAAGTLTGTTLNATVVSSSLTSVGTITTGTWNGTPIANAYLANSTISGIALGGNLNDLTIGTGLTGTSYNGSTGVTIAIDSTVVTLTGSQVLTNKTLTAPTINGGTHTAITSLGIRSTGTGAFDLTIANTENLTAGRTLTITLNDASRTLNLGGNLTTAGSFTTVGANSLTLTTTGATNVTLPTSGTLVNSSVTTLSSLSSIGTITTGTWNASIISPTYGGTGVNNGLSTITLGGNFATSGANSLTLTTTGATNVTLPTSGTLVNSSVTTLSSLSSIGTITTGTWNASVIGVTYGGTGTSTTFTQGSIVFAGASGVYNQNNSNLFWDNTNNRLGINVSAAPAEALHVGGNLRIDPVTGVTSKTTGATINTTDSTTTTILTIPVPSGSVLLVEARVTARKTGGAGAGNVGDGNTYIRTIKVKNVSGTVTAGTTQSTFTDEDIPPFKVTYSVSGTNLLLRVTGAINDNVTWNAVTTILQ